MIEYPGKDTFSRESARRLLWLTRRGGCHTSWQEAGPDVSEGLTFKREEENIPREDECRVLPASPR